MIKTYSNCSIFISCLFLFGFVTIELSSGRYWTLRLWKLNSHRLKVQLSDDDYSILIRQRGIRWKHFCIKRAKSFQKGPNFSLKLKKPFVKYFVLKRLLVNLKSLIFLYAIHVKSLLFLQFFVENSVTLCCKVCNERLYRQKHYKT